MINNFELPKGATLLIIQITITIGVLFFLWRVVDGLQTGEVLASAQPKWLLAGLLLLSMQTMLSAMRWRLTSAQLGLDLSFRVALREYYLSQMINQVLPGGVVGDASRAVRSRGQQGLVAASQAVIFERFSGQVALFIVMMVAIATTFVIPDSLDWPSWSLLVVGAIVLGVTSAAIVFGLIARLRNPLRPKALALTHAMMHALLARQVVLAQITLSFATVLCNLLAFACCARAIGVVLSPIMIFALVPIILFTMLIPITVMGWGLREGAAVAFLPLAGATPSSGLVASIAFGLTLLAASVPGLLPIWVSQRSIKPEKDIKS